MFTWLRTCYLPITAVSICLWICSSQWGSAEACPG